MFIDVAVFYTAASLSLYIGYHYIFLEFELIIIIMKNEIDTLVPVYEWRLSSKLIQ